MALWEPEVNIDKIYKGLSQRQVNAHRLAFGREERGSGGGRLGRVGHSRLGSPLGMEGSNGRFGLWRIKPQSFETAVGCLAWWSMPIIPAIQR